MLKGERGLAMLKIATAQEMQNIDRITIKRLGVAGIVLMERAGLGVAKRVNEIYFQSTVPGLQERDRKVIVLCGGGNNGGDGFVIARVLHNQGKKVEVCLMANPGSLHGDAKINYDAARKFGVRIRFGKHQLPRSVLRTARDCIIIDALLGTGLSREVRAPLCRIIRAVNKMPSPVVSVDIPSGVSSDSGQIMGCAIKAQHTITFGLAKRGHFLYPGAEHTGILFIEDIGFPKALLDSEKIKVHVIEKNDISSLLRPRPRYSHKGTYGHVLLIAGSRGKTGAALMAARACLRTGAGLVTIGIPETLVNAFQSRVTEEMILPLPDKGDGSLSCTASAVVSEFLRKRASVLAIGPGLSVDNEISRLVSVLVKESRVPIVLDADGINALAGRTGVLKQSRAPLVLTPHGGEMARLLKRRSKSRGRHSDVTGGRIDVSRRDLRFNLHEEIEKDRITIAMTFAKKTRTYLVLKGVPTVIATPDGRAFINPTGNPGMATAGTGDVLTGMIAAFLAQKYIPREAAIAGVYLHGFIGDMVAEKKGQRSVVASDLINAIAKAFKSLRTD